MSAINAYVSWPSASLTNSLVHKALANISLPILFISKKQVGDSSCSLLEWSTYDDIDHELVHFQRSSVLSSSYTFRKALIRKHYLSRVIHHYTTKHPQSILRDACPRTFEIELSFADELEEMWTDELWELGEELDSGRSWWILKPGMADRGMGIRIFHNKEDLHEIFEGFDESDDEAENHDSEETSVVTSQLRHFVIQEYIDTPLLLDPSETLNKGPSVDGLVGRKFHLRVYCVAKGDIQLFVYNRVLALFSSVPYNSFASQGAAPEFSEIDLKAHLTNTSLQTELGDSNVRLLDELEGCHILSDGSGQTLTSSDINGLVTEISEVLADVFRAASQNPVHFQALPNAFELFGVDFLVSHVPRYDGNKFHAKLLEINAEPAIELTGPRLTWILEDLFNSTAKVCVEPFFMEKKDTESWNIGEVKHNFLKCMDENIRGPTV